MSAIDPKQFRSALGSFPTGVTVVTTLDKDGNKVGMTANSFNSVSLEPMLVLWSIAKSANAFDAFNDAKQFAIHILNEEQQGVSNQFAQKGIDRFDGIEYRNGHGNVPVLADYTAAFECDIEHQYDGGDHVILVGRVQKFDHKDKAPLVFHAGRYTELAQAEAL